MILTFLFKISSSRIEVLAVLYLFTGVRVTGMFEKQGFPSIWDDSLSQFLRNFEEDCIFTKDTHFSYPSVHLVEKRYADIETLSVHSNKVNVQYFRNVYQYKTILFKAKERPRFSSIQHTLEIFAARVRKLKHILEAFGVSLYNTISSTVTSARETIKELKDIIAEQNIQIQAGRSLHDLGIAVSITYPGSDLHSAEKSPKGLGRLSIYSITAFIWSSLKWERTLQCRRGLSFIFVYFTLKVHQQKISIVLSMLPETLKKNLFVHQNSKVKNILVPPPHILL